MDTTDRGVISRSPDFIPFRAAICGHNRQGCHQQVTRLHTVQGGDLWTQQTGVSSAGHPTSYRSGRRSVDTTYRGVISRSPDFTPFREAICGHNRQGCHQQVTRLHTVQGGDLWTQQTGVSSAGHPTSYRSGRRSVDTTDTPMSYVVQCADYDTNLDPVGRSKEYMRRGTADNTATCDNTRYIETHKHLSQICESPK